MVKASLEKLSERKIFTLRNNLAGLNEIGHASSTNNYAVAEPKKKQTSGSIFGFMVWDGLKDPRGYSRSIQQSMQLIIAHNGQSVKVEVPSNNSLLETLCVDVAANKFPDMGNKRSVAVVEYTPPRLNGKRQIVSIALLPYGLDCIQGVMLKFLYPTETEKAQQVKYDSILNHPELVISKKSTILKLLGAGSGVSLENYTQNSEFFSENDTTTLGKLERLTHVIAQDSSKRPKGFNLTNALERIQNYEHDAIFGLSEDDRHYASNISTLVSWAEVSRATSKMKDKPRTELSFYELAHEKKLRKEEPFDKDPKLLIYHPASEDFYGKIRIGSGFYHPTLCDMCGNNVVGTVTSITKGRDSKKPTDFYSTFIVSGKIVPMRLIVNYTGSLMGLVWGQELLPQVYAQNQQKNKGIL